MKMRFEKFECQKRYQISPSFQRVSYHILASGFTCQDIITQPPLRVFMIAGMPSFEHALGEPLVAMHASESGAEREFTARDGGG